MAIEALLQVRQNNDETLIATITSPTALAYTTAGKAFEFYIKSRRSDADVDAVGKVIGSILTDSTVQFQVPAAYLQQHGTFFWRIDQVIAGSRKTAGYGPLEVVDL